MFGRGKKQENASQQVLETEDEAEKAVVSRQIDAALDDPKFVDFLEKHAEGNLDNIDVSDDNSLEILDKYQIFMKCQSASGEIKRVIKDELFRDTKIQLEDADLAQVEAYIENTAVSKGPEGGAYLDHLSKQLEQFKANGEQMRDMDQQIQGLQDSYESKDKAWKAANKLGWVARKSSRFINKISGGLFMAEQSKVLDQAEDLDIDINNLRKARNGIDKEGKTLNELRAAQKQFHDFRTGLLREIALNTKLIEKVKERLSQKLTGAVNENASVNELDQVQTEVDGLDSYYKDLPEDFNESLDRMLREKITAETKDAVRDVSTEKRGQLSSMEARLNKLFMRRETGIGSSKTPEEIKDFIGEALADIYKHGNLDSRKKLLIRRVCAKNKVDLDSYLADKPRYLHAENPASDRAAAVEGNPGENPNTESETVPYGESSEEASSSSAEKDPGSPDDQPSGENKKEPSADTTPAATAENAQPAADKPVTPGTKPRENQSPDDDEQEFFEGDI